MDSALVIVLATLALMVRAGQVLAGIGMSRAKSAASAGARGLVDVCVATIAFWAVGAAILLQQSSAFCGIRTDHLLGWCGMSANWFGLLSMALISTGIVGPALAERSRLSVVVVAGAIMAGVIVPVVGHWVARGWLANLGAIDLAGASAVHLTAATCAVVCAIFVGARDGKYNRDGSSNMIPGHSLPLLIGGVLLMLVGWVPYVGLASLVRGREAAVGSLAANVVISAAAGGLTSMLVGWFRFGKVDILQTISGILGGLVSITAAAGTVGTPASFLIGAVAGLVIPWITVVLDLRLKLDDPAGVIAIHGIGGMWALLSAAVFLHDTIGNRLRLLGVQVLTIAVTVAVAGMVTAVAMLILKSTIGVRASEADEFDGLDLAEHDINAHPDFQQTMIKSYHLREA